MKVGMRTPNLKKSLKARTTGKIKREFKKSINPLYNKKGMGWINDPEKAAYNKVYNKTTVSAKDFLEDSNSSYDSNSNADGSFIGAIGGIFSIIGNIIMLLFYLAQVLFYGALLIGIFYVIFKILF